MLKRFSFLLFIAIATNLNAQSIAGLKGNIYQLDNNQHSITSDNLRKQNTKEAKKLSYRKINNFLKEIKLRNEVSIFAVFEGKQEPRRVSITSGLTRKLLFNDSVSGKALQTEVKEVGSIQSFHSVKSFMKEISVTSLEGEIDNNTEVDINELIVIPRAINSLERHKIETQLSIKHGISLCMDCDYYDPKGKIIWNSSKNPEYNNSVFGLAADSEFNFEKTIANHKKDKDLTFNIVNEGGKNANNYKTYALLGSNNRALQFSKNQINEEFISLDKSWVLGITGNAVQNEKLKFTLKLNDEVKAAYKMLKEKIVRVSVSDSSSNFLTQQNPNGQDWYEVELRNDSITFALPFNKICKTDSTSYKTIKLFFTPQMFAKSSRNYDCENRDFVYDFQVIGGTYPFNIDFLDVSGNHKKTIAYNSEFTIKSKIQGNNITMTDSHGILYLINLQKIESEANQNVNVLLQYEDVEKICVASILTNSTSGKIEWVNDMGELVGTGNQIPISKTGDYLVKVTENGQCKLFRNFRVDFDNRSQNVLHKVFPNPVLAGTSYKICQSLNEGEKVKVETFDVNGKEISKEIAIAVNNCLHLTAPNFAGTYYVRLSTPKNSTTTKILVN